MPMNRVQFHPGMSLQGLLERYGTEAQCEAELARLRWPQGFRCPRCGEREYCRFARGGQWLWQCAACRHQTSVRAGTVLEASKLALRTWMLVMFLITQAKNDVSALELKRHLGVCYRTAWLVKHKLMLAMAHRESTRTLSDVVQIDDAFLGGERTGGKRGRGSENKVPFIAAVQTRRGKPLYARFDLLSDWRAHSVAQWARHHLAPGAHVVSDGLQVFKAVTEAGCTHEPIAHGTGKQSAQHPRFIWVNTLLGNLKRSLSGTYHAFRALKYGQRYLAEFQYRFNRRFDLPGLVPRLAADAVLLTPWPEKRLRTVAELHR